MNQVYMKIFKETFCIEMIGIIVGKLLSCGGKWAIEEYNVEVMSFYCNNTCITMMCISVCGNVSIPHKIANLTDMEMK